MDDSPIFSKVEADSILKRAAEIEGSEDTRPLTIAELRSIAGEAGFGSEAVERAIVEAQRAAPEVRHHPVHRAGWIFAQLSTVRTLRIETSSDHLMEAVRLFQPYREGPARVDLGQRQITWRDRKGLRFTLTSAGGATEIRVYVPRVILRKGMRMGWVKSAADQLEALVFLVATRGRPSTTSVTAQLPTPESSVAGSALTSGS